MMMPRFRAAALFWGLLVGLVLLAGQVFAQTLPSAAPADNAAANASSPEADPYGRTTPQGMVAGLMNALAAADYERAARFFETDSVQGERSW